mgnify:CR=1 FL=1
MNPVFRGLEFGQFGFHGLLGNHLESGVNRCVNLQPPSIDDLFGKKDGKVAHEIVQGRAGVLAKIEKPKALASLHGILELADALMVARGDLGVEMPLERVPGLQKQITRAARKAGKPVVVATQMLESMISSPMPTSPSPLGSAGARLGLMIASTIT